MFSEKLVIKFMPCVEVMPLGTKALYWRESFGKKIIRQISALIEDSAYTSKTSSLFQNSRYFD